MEKSVNSIFKLFIQYQQFHLKIGSISNYYNLANNHLLYYFGNRIMDNITTEELMEFVQKEKHHNKNKNASLSDKTYHDIIVLINSIWGFAYHQGLIKNNIIIPLFTISENKVQTFDDIEREYLIKYLANHITPYNVGILLSLTTGIRIGELCALQWCDFDLNRGILKITKTLQRIKNLDVNATTKTKIIIDTPKTERSVRDIPIPNFLTTILNRYKGSKTDYILTNSLRYIEPRTLQKYFKKLLNEINISYKNFHVLRHTFATHFYSLTHDIKTLSELMGHQNEAYTMKKYIHLDFNYKKEQINSLYLDVAYA